MPPVLLEETPFGESGLAVARYRFDNGLTLLFVEDHSAPVFAYLTWFDVGSANETPGKTGIAHLFEHLLFKATKNIPDGEFDRVMESRGGSTNAATWVDWTFYTSGLPSRDDNFELVAKLESDRMVNLVLNDAQVEAEREVVLNERRYRVDNSPDGLLSEELYALAFTRHPYHWPTIGWERDIRAITTQDCLDFYRVWYAPNNATIVVVGDVERKRALEVIGAAYAGIASQAVPQESFALDGPPGDKRKIVPLTIESDKLLVAWRVPGLEAPERPALAVLEALAFGGMSARTRRRLVDELAIATDIGSMLTPFKYPGLLEVKVEVREDQTAEAVEKELDAVLHTFVESDVPADELEKAKNQLELGFLSALRTSSEKAEALGSWHATLGDYRRLFDEVPRIRAVTAADVRRAAASVFRPESRAVVIGRPKE